MSHFFLSLIFYKDFFVKNDESFNHSNLKSDNACLSAQYVLRLKKALLTGDFMKLIYDNLDIHFKIQRASFSVVNLALERIMTPIPEHSHGTDCFELHYIADGYGTIKINDTLYDVGPDSLYLTSSNMRHEQIPSLSNPMLEYCVYFRYKDYADRHTISNVLLNLTFEIHHNLPSVSTPLMRVFTELKEKRFAYITKVTMLLQESLIELVRIHQLRNTNPVLHTRVEIPTVEDKKTFLIEKAFIYEYKDLTLAKLADSLNLSPRQTERFLKEHYQQTFSKKRTEARMSAATILLRDRSLTLLEIARRLGYSSLEYFVNQFKSYYQMSPQEYVRRISDDCDSC